MVRVRPKAGSRRRVVAGDGTSASAANRELQLDDRPLRIEPTRDGKRLLVTMPYEVWTIATKTRSVESTFELPSAIPAPYEGEDGTLWLGGNHLYKTQVLGGGQPAKTGTKLGGLVDRVCQLPSGLLCGVGQTGEVLLDPSTGDERHRRKASERTVSGLVVANDGRAVWIDGTHSAWVLDPDHLSGYTKLKLPRSSADECSPEQVVALARSSSGRIVLASRDGSVAWTTHGLRMEAQRDPGPNADRLAPLSVAADANFVYVLRPSGVLHRFLIRVPKDLDPSSDEELPPAQRAGLRRPATCMCLDADGQIWLAAPSRDGELGRLWACEALEWEELPLRERPVRETEAAATAPKRPDFTQTKHKPEGPPIRDLRVDDVLKQRAPMLTAGQGSLLERAVQAELPSPLLPADTLLLPAMIRSYTGTTRPALLVWPAVADADREVPEPTWLCWGDEPRGWIPMDTPSLRAQGWRRREIFPLQAAIPMKVPEAPGHRAKLPAAWFDPQGFEAMATECKRLLKVLW